MPKKKKVEATERKRRRLPQRFHRRPKKVKPTFAAGKEIYTPKQVERALRKAGGVKTTASRLLRKWTGVGCGHRSVVNHYLDRYPYLREILEEIEDATKDLAEDKLFKVIKNEARKDHLRAVTFYLATKAKDRGYTRRSELTGEDGKPLHPPPELYEVDLSKLTDEELNVLEKIYAKAEINGSNGTGKANGLPPGPVNGKDSHPEREGT